MNGDPAESLELLEQIAEAAEAARDAQRTYFRTGRRDHLRDAQARERELDSLLARRHQRRLI